MQVLYLACVFVVLGEVSGKGLLPTIPINENLAKILPAKFINTIKDLNAVFEEFNDKVDMEKLQPALEKGGEAGKAALTSLSKLITLFATGQFVNPIAIGNLAQEALTTTIKTQEALQAVEDIPLEIPAAKAIKFVLQQFNKVLTILRCAQPFNCFKIGRR